MPRTYTPEEREAALRVYAERGTSAAHRESGVPKSTISAWARKEGIRCPDSGAMAAALRASQARTQQLRETFRRDLLRIAQKCLVKVEEVARSPGAASSKPAGAAAKDWAITAAILLDKYRLEAGEAVARTEVFTGDAHDRLAQRLDEIAERRTRRLEVERRASGVAEVVRLPQTRT